jgi:hypothetical protein
MVWFQNRPPSSCTSTRVSVDMWFRGFGTASSPEASGAKEVHNRTLPWKVAPRWLVQCKNITRDVGLSGDDRSLHTPKRSPLHAIDFCWAAVHLFRCRQRYRNDLYLYGYYELRWPSVKGCWDRPCRETNTRHKVSTAGRPSILALKCVVQNLKLSIWLGAAVSELRKV